jgi:uncharacterized membrane protein YwzB
VWQITVCHILLIIVIGILLYYFILYLLGLGGDRYLKKRRKASIKEQESRNTKIFQFYLCALCIVIGLCFLLISYWSRGVA